MRSNSSLDILRRRTDAQPLFCQTHLLRESRMWNPRGAVPRVHLLHHLVDLLERQTLGLGNEEVGKGG